MAKSIDIQLNTKANTTGAEKIKSTLKGLGAIASKVGEAVGGANTMLGQMVSSVLGGGIFLAIGAGLGFAIKKIQEWWTASERAEKEAAKAAKEAHSERMKCMDEYASAIEKVAQKRLATINQNKKAIDEEIDATKELTKATLELEKAEARKRGDTSRMAEIDREMDAVDTEAARMKLENDLESNQKRKEHETKSLEEARIGRMRAENEANWIEDVLGSRLDVIADKARKEAKGEAVFVNSVAGGSYIYGNATEEDRKKAADSAIEAFKKTDEYKELANQLKEAQKKAETFKEKMDSARASVQEATKAEENLSKRLAALQLKEEAKNKNTEAQTVELEKQRVAQKKATELKAMQEAAKERERLDKEAHQKRMDMLKAEIAASEKLANPLKAVASAAQSEFDRAFAMYRDPEKAAAAIGEEKAYSADLDRLHRDATRYGGKWRIDELSRLMATGDSQGVTDTLASWRKNSKFTPQVEAMVRASAAERTKTTAEDELRKIEHNTANLAAKVEELLTMKG